MTCSACRAKIRSAIRAALRKRHSGRNRANRHPHHAGFIR